MCSMAVMTSRSAHRSLISGFFLSMARAAIMTPASLIHVWLRAATPRLLLISGSLTTMNLQGCLLLAEGASCAAVRIWFRCSSGMGWGFYLRKLLLVLMASNSFMRVFGGPRGVTGSHQRAVDSGFITACLL